VGNLGVGLTLAFIYSWTVTLSIIAFIPLMIALGVLQTMAMTGFQGKDKKILEEAGKVDKIK
jgi:ABC-type bacteriocin/lantibiotic exporter with double-glycine peptidase domain